MFPGDPELVSTVSPGRKTAWGPGPSVQDFLWVVFVQRDQMKSLPPLPRLPESGGRGEGHSPRGRGGAGLELLWLLRPGNILCILPTLPCSTALDPDHWSSCLDSLHVKGLSYNHPRQRRPMGKVWPWNIDQTASQQSHSLSTILCGCKENAGDSSSLVLLD